MRRSASLVVAAVVAGAALSAAPSLDRVRAEIDRVRRESAGVPADTRPAIESRLQAAASAVERGRAYLALYELERPYEIAGGFAWARTKGDVKTAEAFDQAWTSAGEPRWSPHPRGDRPVVLDALANATGARAPITYRAARPYSADSDIGSGLYYLGNSRALAAYADFVESLDWRAGGRRPPIRSIARELDVVDREITTAYEAMTRAEHPVYIQASEALKEARALNDAHVFDAALLEYLIARLRFAPLRKTTYPEATGNALSAARSGLDAAVDHSVAELFVEVADAALARGDADSRRTAAIVLADILPAYAAAIAPEARPATTEQAARVTITLVRWPFT